MQKSHQANAPIQCRHDRTKQRRTEPQRLTAPCQKRGDSGNIKFCAFNYLCAGRQFCASKPRLRQAAKRYLQP
ncbi:MAG: hypothetical protein IPI59_16195 [Sphingobacteriales bacterium]|nr:hypothetical protein [Sphingobacteriales bacterium]MBK7529025.1 hypothetical protein [Sphingobacteriales bacterium]MBK8678990.1 hypothetical protein [Sphingobacteriales bacterium]